MMPLHLRKLALVALTITGLVGPGLSYGPCYAFHVVLVAVASLLLWFEGGRIVGRLREERWTLWYFLAFGVLSLIALFRSPSVNEGLITVVSLGCGHALLIALILLVNDPQLWRTVLFTSAVVMSTELVLSLLEAAELARWPISRFSSAAELFGRPNDLAELTDTPSKAAYIASSPTGFHWNPNDLCTGLCLFLPFTLTSRRWWVGALVAAAVLVVVLAAGARIAYVVVALIAFMAIFFRVSRIAGLVTLIMVLIVSTNGFSARYSEAVKLREMQVFSRVLVGADIDLAQLQMSSAEEEGSAAMRKHIYRSGIEAVRVSRGLGMGLGASAAWLGAHPIPGGRVLTDMHNWWLELAVDLGLLGLLALFVWLVGVVLLIWKKIDLRDRGNGSRVGLAFVMAFIALVPLALGPSSMAYSLPMFMLFALAVLAPKYLGPDRGPGSSVTPS